MQNFTRDRTFLDATYLLYIMAYYKNNNNKQQEMVTFDKGRVTGCHDLVEYE